MRELDLLLRGTRTRPLGQHFVDGYAARDGKRSAAVRSREADDNEGHRAAKHSGKQRDPLRRSSARHAVVVDPLVASGRTMSARISPNSRLSLVHESPPSSLK